MTLSSKGPEEQVSAEAGIKRETQKLREGK